MSHNSQSILKPLVSRPGDINPTDIWHKLSSAISEIFNEKTGELSYEELHRSAYNLVLHRHGEMLYNNVKQQIREHLHKIAKSIVDDLECHLLKSLLVQWQNYVGSMIMIRDILMHLDRNYVTKNKLENVYIVGIRLFFELVLCSAHVSKGVKHHSLEMIQRDRSYEMIDRPTIKGISKMYSDIGKMVYIEHFEKPILEAAAKFFRSESQRYLEECSVSEYLKKVETRLQEEQDRTDELLESCSKSKLIAAIQAEMIERVVTDIVDNDKTGVDCMLKFQKMDDLGRMYRLFAQCPSALLVLRDKFCQFVLSQGLDFVNDSEVNSTPVDYTRGLLALRETIENFISQSFQGDRLFVNAAHQSFTTFVNKNSRTPEYLSLFIDYLLRESPRQNAEETVVHSFERLIVIFRYISDKDVFELYYKKQLSKRLLSGKKNDLEIEKHFVQLLKSECGYQFVHKLECMFKDQHVSGELMSEYKAYCKRLPSPASVDMQVMVLSSGNWPVEKDPDINFPPFLMNACELYKNFYLKKYVGRRLTWQFGLGSVDMRLNFRKGRYDVSLSSYMMIVLLLFNNQNEISFETFQSVTGIPERELRRALVALSCRKYRLLNKEPKGTDVANGDVFSVNDKFTSKYVKFKISAGSGRGTDEQPTDTMTQIVQDRRHEMDAAIVRVMKTRKSMLHVNLVSEVLTQLSRFKPDPKEVKKRIEYLIEREFLERVAGNSSMYQYCP